jgi:hypothetical protein
MWFCIHWDLMQNPDSQATIPVTACTKGIVGLRNPQSLVPIGEDGTQCVTNIQMIEEDVARKWQQVL